MLRPCFMLSFEYFDRRFVTWLLLAFDFLCKYMQGKTEIVLFAKYQYVDLKTQLYKLFNFNSVFRCDIYSIYSCKRPVRYCSFFFYPSTFWSQYVVGYILAFLSFSRFWFCLLTWKCQCDLKHCVTRANVWNKSFEMRRKVKI